jgi:hypothetical protein
MLNTDLWLMVQSAAIHVSGPVKAFSVEHAAAITVPHTGWHCERGADSCHLICRLAKYLVDQHSHHAPTEGNRTASRSYISPSAQ